MFDLLLSFIIYFIAIVLHIVVHRLLVSKGIVTFKTISIFGAALILNAWILLAFALEGFTSMHLLLSIRLPLFALVSSFLAMLLYVLFFTSPFWGEESPSIKIFFLVKRNKRMLRSTIMNNFTNDDIINKRLNFLVNSEHISQRKNVYYANLKGKKLLTLIEIYRKILRWHEGG